MLFPNLHSNYRFLEIKKLILDTPFSIFDPQVDDASQIVACLFHQINVWIRSLLPF